MNFDSPNVGFIFDMFSTHGYKIYAVGGCVRDFLLGREPKDVDFCTDATPKEMKDIWTQIAYMNKLHLISTGEKFGTLTIRFPDEQEQFEVTTFRADGRYEDGRHPKEVSYTKILEEDLSRRDFTINAIAYSENGDIIDPFGGIKDIENKIIRCVGNPRDRFNEDALRIIRCVRFALRYDFTIEEETRNALLELMDNIKFVSKERIGKELSEMLEMNLEVKNSYNVCLLESITSRLNKNFVEYPTQYNNRLLNWAAFASTSSSTEQQFVTFLNSFAVGSEIVDGVKNIERGITFLSKDNIKEFMYKQVLDIVRTEEERRGLLAMVPKEMKDIIVDAWIDGSPYCIKQLAINGDDIMKALGIPPGPNVKSLLELCLDNICKTPSLNKKELLLEKLKYYICGGIEDESNQS